MRVHDLKCWPEPFAALKDGVKNFEFRKDDRGFAVGDHLRIHEWDPHGGTAHLGDFVRNHNHMIAAPLWFEVIYILHGGRFGVPPGFVVMGIESLAKTGTYRKS